MFQCKYLGSLLRVRQKQVISSFTSKQVMGTFFPFPSFCYFFLSHLITFQYYYILCLVHQCECINVFHCVRRRQLNFSFYGQSGELFQVGQLPKY